MGTWDGDAWVGMWGQMQGCVGRGQGQAQGHQNDGNVTGRKGQMALWCGVWMCRCLDKWMYGEMDIGINGYEDKWVYGEMDIWMYG